MKVDELFESNQTLNLDFSDARSDLTGAFRLTFPEGATIYEPGGHSSHILFIASGWAVSSKFLQSGTRIVTDFALRGDMISKPAAELAHETIHALTKVECYALQRDYSAGAEQMSPRISSIVMMQMMKRQARMAERLANIGRRDALERTGHLLLELAFRAPPKSRPNFDGFICPLRQADIGDAVGLSTVHINRVLKDMRVNGLLGFRSGVVEFLDRPRLMELVDFDPSYL